MTSRRAALLLIATIGGAVVAAVAGGCARSLDDLEPYPCPTDFPACPDNRTCVPDVGCVTPYLDSPCNDYTDCSLGIEAGRCLGGYCTAFPFVCDPGSCVAPCAADASCSAGHVCDALDANGECLLECTSGEACPAGHSCQAIPARAGRRGCIPSGVSFVTCDSVDSTACPEQCGAAGFSVQCPSGTGASCALNSTCTADDRCICDGGFDFYDCTGQLCLPDCNFPNWYCRPHEASATPGCDETTFLTSGTCHCRDGRLLPYACSELASCSERCAVP